MYKELLEYIVKKLVSNPEVVEVEDVKQDSKLVLKLKIAQEDMGRVIGKEGRIIRSIREIISAYGMRESQKIFVDIEEIK